MTIALLHQVSEPIIWLAIGTTVIGALETYAAIRVGFDIALLKRIQQLDKAPEDTLSQIDNSLIALGFVKPGSAVRDVESRIRGCLRLFRYQALFCIGNMLIIPVGLIWIL